MLLTVLAQVGHDDILSCCCVWKLHSYGQSEPAEQSRACKACMSLVTKFARGQHPVGRATNRHECSRLDAHNT